MDEMELELKARQDSMARFEDQSGRDGADASLILADALTYAAGASAFITAAIDAIENGGFDRRIGILLGAGFGLWLCSQSLNNFRRLLPVWLRVVLGMRILPETFEEQSVFSRKRRMWTIVVAAGLTAVIAIQFTLDDTSIATRSGIPFHYVLWVIVALDILVAIQWSRVIGNANRIVDRPGGWS
ncbi:MAG TPA: hypothetical protein HA309_03550 [Candidatus Thalassarchaeaceae archaeon]|nr:hypothetical protein [Candidatus Thalassarchaeaceae archaeon]|tara:strand:- start:175 stop:729 length:555 start_codon:yes stop_codon:yes gene_type:complete